MTRWDNSSYLLPHDFYLDCPQQKSKPLFPRSNISKCYESVGVNGFEDGKSNWPCACLLKDMRTILYAETKTNAINFAFAQQMQIIHTQTFSCPPQSHIVSLTPPTVTSSKLKPTVGIVGTACPIFSAKRIVVLPVHSRTKPE